MQQLNGYLLLMHNLTTNNSCVHIRGAVKLAKEFFYGLIYS
ncbi:hypothetical protein EV201_1830 [Ancylomarina subtilis]|uniref:Uncharacterized protein n=1 Tax=Ancylomarina subtilis TaxID=1639035 RepID=A0A4Q7VLP4_9BACT|nr:hypothetical protein EV201_1830 [Ancylomarina subtilis]